MPRHYASRYQYAPTYSHLDRIRDIDDRSHWPIEHRLSWGRHDEQEHRGRPTDLFHDLDEPSDPLPVPLESLDARAARLAKNVMRAHWRCA